MLNLGEVPEEVIMVQLCREMKWTYQEFMNQPAWFIDLLLEVINMEEREKERRIKLAELREKTKLMR